MWGYAAVAPNLCMHAARRKSAARRGAAEG